LTAITKEVDIRGQKFVIRRFPAVIGEEANKALRDAEKFKVVFLGTVQPEYASPEEVKQEDWEIVDHLFLDIAEFNQMEPAFLSRLKNLSSLVSPQPPKQKS
jgi:hypothetical protein